MTQQPHAPAATTGVAGGAQPVLEMVGIEKAYGGVRALRNASLRLGDPGTVHTLIGQNGCGKSSMLGVLSGQIRPDGGEIRMDGHPVTFRNPAASVSHGIAMVSQETALADDLSVMENVLLGRLVRGRLGVDWSASARKAGEVLGRLGLDYDPRAIVADLRPDQRQMVEIARAISMDARVLILDEPTSSLNEREVGELFEAVRSLSSHRVAIIFVSHRLPEIFEISDSLTVMRDGQTISTGPITDYTPSKLVDQMVGAAARAAATTRATSAAPKPATKAAPVLETMALSAANVRDVNLDVHPGEIVGVAGLAGSGRNELLEALFGLHPIDSGGIKFDGTSLGSKRSPRVSIASGMAYLPPDRKTQGLVLPMSVGDNLTIVSTHRRSRLTFPARGPERRKSSELAKILGIRTPSLDAPVQNLSGGNQQKVAIGKWLTTTPQILLLDDPTRGVDVAAKAEIHAQLRDAAKNGLAILVTSSEVPELIELCDRIAVMRRGEITAWFDRDDATETAIASESAESRAS